MSQEKATATAVYVEANRGYRPLIEDDAYYVTVSHQELDGLIGTLMHMFELNGDVEQRNALKQETKWRCREWLDNLYGESGYDKHTGVKEGVVPFKTSSELKTSVTNA